MHVRTYKQAVMIILLIPLFFVALQNLIVNHSSITPSSRYSEAMHPKQKSSKYTYANTTHYAVPLGFALAVFLSFFSSFAFFFLSSFFSSFLRFRLLISASVLGTGLKKPSSRAC
jgi:hypothetical protein